MVGSANEGDMSLISITDVKMGIGSKAVCVVALFNYVCLLNYDIRCLIYHFLGVQRHFSL